MTRRHGDIRLRLDATEAALLAQLVDDFAAAVESGEMGVDDPVTQRLFPSGYADDDEAATEFRSLTEPALRSERCDRARQCSAELAEHPDEIALDAEAAQRWLKVLNDLRLTLGTRLGVTEQDSGDFDPAAADAQPRSVYLWLTAVQDSLVTAVMR